MDTLMIPIARGLSWLVVGTIVLLLARLLYRFVAPYHLEQELTERDNPAVGVAFTGYLAGVVAIFIGAISGPEPEFEPTIAEFLIEIATVAGYVAGGVAAMAVGRIMVDRLVLTKFSIRKEIVEDRNAGTAAVVAGAHFATGLVIAGAVGGDGGGWWSALAFFALGQIALAIFGRIYAIATPYDVHDEIERDNVAAGVAFGLSFAALGLVMMRATSGDFVDWTENLIDFGYYTVAGVVAIVVLQRIADRLLLPGTSLPAEIVRDRNLNAAWIEGGTAMMIAAIAITVL